MILINPIWKHLTSFATSNISRLTKRNTGTGSSEAFEIVKTIKEPLNQTSTGGNHFNEYKAKAKALLAGIDGLPENVYSQLAFGILEKDKENGKTLSLLQAKVEAKIESEKAAVQAYYLSQILFITQR